MTAPAIRIRRIVRKPSRLQRAFDRIGHGLTGWLARQSKAGAARVRERAMVAELLGWLPEHYQREVRGIVEEHAARPQGWWR